MSADAPAGQGRHRPIRAFVALDIPEALRDELAALLVRLRPGVPGIRWVRPGSMHVTLRFLGWSRPEALEAMKPALAAAARGCPPLDTTVGGLGLFPPRGRARVLWVGVAALPAAWSLQEACERAARSAGFEPEGRAFQPHLTLGRWKEPARPPRLPAADLGTVRLDRLVLFESRLSASGSAYAPLETWGLGAG